MSSRGGSGGSSSCLTWDSCLTSHTLPNPKLSCGHASDSSADSRHHRQALNIHWHGIHAASLHLILDECLDRLIEWDLSEVKSFHTDQCSLCFYLKMCSHRNIFSVGFSLFPCTYLLSCGYLTVSILYI